MREPLESRFHEASGQAVEIIAGTGGAFGQQAGRGEARQGVDFQKVSVAVFANDKIDPGEIPAPAGVEGSQGKFPQRSLDLTK